MYSTHKVFKVSRGSSRFFHSTAFCTALQSCSNWPLTPRCLSCYWRQMDQVYLGKARLRNTADYLGSGSALPPPACVLST